jgi:hypothetical protein
VTSSTCRSTIQNGGFIEVQKVTTESIGAAAVRLCDRYTLANVLGNMLIGLKVSSGKKTVATGLYDRFNQLVRRRTDNNTTIRLGSEPAADDRERIIGRRRWSDQVDNNRRRKFRMKRKNNPSGGILVESALYPMAGRNSEGGRGRQCQARWCFDETTRAPQDRGGRRCNRGGCRRGKENGRGGKRRRWYRRR